MLDYRLVGQKIREVRQAQSLSLRELADMVGYNHVTILGWEKGRRRISLDDLSRVSKALGVDIEYFLDAESTLGDTVVKRSIVREKLADILGVIYVPLVGKVQAGKPVLAVESIEQQIAIPQVMVKEGERVFALRVSGDSMVNAGISDGDIAIIRKQEFLDYPGQIAVVIVDDEGTLKRVCQSSDGSWWLVSENPKFKPIRLVSIGDAHIVGVYIGLIKLPKPERSVTDFVPPPDIDSL